MIPLVQTFGHLQFVLKHPQFEHMRDHPTEGDSICPCHPQAVNLIKSMLDQVIEAHQQISPLRYLHLGADEVWHLGTCSSCAETNLSREDLYKNFVIPLLQHVRDKSIVPLMWDDMMREWPEEELQSVDALPVVWEYKPDVAAQFPPDMYVVHT